MESNDIKKERHRSIGSIGSYIQIDKLANKIKEKLDDTARDQLPDKYKNITKKQKIGLLFFTQVTAAAVFVYFCYQSYQSQINAVFLALESSSGICSNVAKSVTGIFTASHRGYWSGQENYKSNEGLYRFVFSNLYATKDEFASLIQEYNDNFLQPLGKVAKSDTSQYNLLKLLYYTAKIEREGFIQKLDFIVDPSIVFAGRKFMGLLNKKLLYTGIPDRIDYDFRTGRITYNFDVKKVEIELMSGYVIPGTNTTIGHVCLMDQQYFEQQKLNYADSSLLSRYVNKINPAPTYWVLNDILDIGLLDYNPQFGSNFAFEFDQVTLTSAAAVNLGILPFQDLLDAGYGSIQGFYKGVTYDLKYYIVDKYSYMTPMICLSKIDGVDSTADHPFTNYCFYKLGKFHEVPYITQLPMLAIPSFMNMGYNPRAGKVGTLNGEFFFPNGPILRNCICPLPVLYNLNLFGQTTNEEQPSECNDFSFFSSLVFFPESNYGPGLSDAFFTWLDSGDQIYCTITDTTYSQNHCDLEAELQKCPDTNTDQSSEAFKTCANAVANIYIEKYYQFVWGLEIGPVIDLVTRYSAKDLNEVIYDASFSSCGPFYIPNSDGSKCPSSFDSEYDIVFSQYKPTSFCNDECTVLVTTTDNGYLDSFALNTYLRQEAYLSCNDTFSVTKDVLELLKNNAPTQLIEQYLECTASPSDAIQTAIGIATGWVGLVTPILLMIAITLISLYYQLNERDGLPPSDESIKDADLQEKFDYLLNRYETVKQEAEAKITSLQIELQDAKKISTLTQVDLIKLKNQQKEKEKISSSSDNDMLRTITFGLV